MSDDLHRDVGAYILGALDADERAEFEQHLESCSRCRAELVDLAPIPGLMSAVDVEQLDVDSMVSIPAVVDEAGRQYAAIERSRRRWRLAAGALTAAAAVVAVLFVGASTASDPVPTPSRDIELAFTASAPVDGNVWFGERSWGTRVEIDLVGLPLHDGYEIWAVAEDGAWELAASFGPADDGTCHIIGATSFDSDDIAQLVVTTTGRDEQLLWASP